MALICRFEDDVVAFAPVALDGAFAAIDARDDDVADFRFGLVARHHVVAIPDADIDHRIAPHSQHEELAAAREVGWQRQQLLDVLLSEHVGACRDLSDERHVTGRPPLAFHSCLPVAVDDERPGPRRVAPDPSVGFERSQVAVHGRRRIEIDLVADLAHGRGVAALALHHVDELEHGALALIEMCYPLVCGADCWHGEPLRSISAFPASVAVLPW